MENAHVILDLKQKYTILRNEFLMNARQIDDLACLLETLKIRYSQCISPRTLSHARTLEALLRILEKRDKLSYDNIEPLLYIQSQYIKDTKLERLLSDYDRDKNKSSLVYCNIYNITPSGGSQSSLTPHVDTHNQTPFDQTDEAIVDTVLLEVSQRLGHRWRDVARFVGIQEHHIDEIDYSPLPLKEKALKALLKSRSMYSLEQWKVKLDRAFEQARRRDLRETMQQLYLSTQT